MGACSGQHRKGRGSAALGPVARARWPRGQKVRRSDGVAATSLTVPTWPTRVQPVSFQGVSHTPPTWPLPETPTLPKRTRTGWRSGHALGITSTPIFQLSVLLFLLRIHYFLINPISVSSTDTSFFNLQLHATAWGGAHSSVSPPSLLPNN